MLGIPATCIPHHKDPKRGHTSLPSYVTPTTCPLSAARSLGAQPSVIHNLRPRSSHHLLGLAASPPPPETKPPLLPQWSNQTCDQHHIISLPLMCVWPYCHPARSH